VKFAARVRDRPCQLEGVRAEKVGARDEVAQPPQAGKFRDEPYKSSVVWLWFLEGNSCMLQRIAICLIFAAAIALAGAAEARRNRPINAVPFSHSPCGALDNSPCTPQFCSVLNHGPCIPEIDYPYGENLQVTVRTAPAKEDASKISAAGSRPRHHRRSLCRAAFLLVAAAC
jgi:hypothetical protein